MLYLPDKYIYGSQLLATIIYIQKDANQLVFAKNGNVYHPVSLKFIKNKFKPHMTKFGAHPYNRYLTKLMLTLNTL